MDETKLFFVVNPANAITDRKLARHFSFDAALKEALRLSGVEPRACFVVLEAAAQCEVIGGRIAWRGNA